MVIHPDPPGPPGTSREEQAPSWGARMPFAEAADGGGEGSGKKGASSSRVSFCPNDRVCEHVAEMIDAVDAAGEGERGAERAEREREHEEHLKGMPAMTRQFVEEMEESDRRQREEMERCMGINRLQMEEMVAMMLRKVITGNDAGKAEVNKPEDSDDDDMVNKPTAGGDEADEFDDDDDGAITLGGKKPMGLGDEPDDGAPRAPPLDEEAEGDGDDMIKLTDTIIEAIAETKMNKNMKMNKHMKMGKNTDAWLDDAQLGPPLDDEGATTVCDDDDPDPCNGRADAASRPTKKMKKGHLVYPDHAPLRSVMGSPFVMALG